MNSNYNLNLIAEAQYKGNTYELSFDPYNDCTDEAGLKELLIQEIINSGDFEEPIEESEVEIDITSYDEIPEDYTGTFEKVFEFAAAFAECEQDIDVVEAALDGGINPSDIDEAYEGSYKDDEDFAYETALSLGAIDKDAKWPNNCIDWGQAAKELMYDYTESNGHYFRNF